MVLTVNYKGIEEDEKNIDNIVEVLDDNFDMEDRSKVANYLIVDNRDIVEDIGEDVVDNLNEDSYDCLKTVVVFSYCC